MRKHNEGLKIARLLMVLSSISPLFILWAIRGSKLVADEYLFDLCALVVVAPNVFLWLRIATAKRLKEQRELVVGKAEDHRDHLSYISFPCYCPSMLQNWQRGGT